MSYLKMATVKYIVYKTPATYLNELKLRTVATIETVTPQMLENTWRETEYRLDISRAVLKLFSIL
jgi:hypothetical protein